MAEAQYPPTNLPKLEGHAMEQRVYLCTRCGECCRWPGTVKLSDQEMEAIASYLGISVQDLIDDYMDLAPDRRKLTLTERPDGGCIFLDEQDRCKIQAVKPQQCKDFPHKWNFDGWEELCPALKMTVRIRDLSSTAGCERE